MASSVTWLDFSEAEQQRVRDLLQFFSDKGTVDDLGLGTIRDAFSNQLFPGTSVVQTRARYFLFVPWIYAEAQRRWPTNLIAKAADMERRLIPALIAGGEGAPGRGVIGREVGIRVKTLPSAIYWGGLQRYGIFRLRGRTIRQYGQMVARGRTALDFEGELVERAPSFWAEAPEPPDGFFDLREESFTLSFDEADWLAERMLTTELPPSPPNLLGELIRSIRRGNHTFAEKDAPWKLALPASTPGSVAEMVHESERFSSLAHGAALLYNLMLVEAFEIATDAPHPWDVDYAEALNTWAHDADDIRLADWCTNLGALWGCLAETGTRIPDSARLFVESFARGVTSIGPAGVVSDEALRSLVRSRELQHKKAQARFGNTKRLLGYPGYAGTSRMEFRWTLVRQLLQDIADGYESE